MVNGGTRTTTQVNLPGWTLPLHMAQRPLTWQMTSRLLWSSSLVPYRDGPTLLKACSLEHFFRVIFCKSGSYWQERDADFGWLNRRQTIERVLGTSQDFGEVWRDQFKAKLLEKNAQTHAIKLAWWGNRCHYHWALLSTLREKLIFMASPSSQMQRREVFWVVFGETGLIQLAFPTPSKGIQKKLGRQISWQISKYPNIHSER